MAKDQEVTYGNWLDAKLRYHRLASGIRYGNNETHRVMEMAFEQAKQVAEISGAIGAIIQDPTTLLKYLDLLTQNEELYQKIYGE